ncbi:hypothetical protein [Bradyrhizobium sp. USDA 3364]
MDSSSSSSQAVTEAEPSVPHTRSESLRLWLPFIIGGTVYLMLISRMSSLLRDSDAYWHIVVGQWIVNHRAVPHVDSFSFTMYGAPWITSAWLSEVIYFVAFKLAGWAGPAILAALSASVAFFLLTLLLLKRLPSVPVAILVSAGIGMATQHVLARPHVLIFPLMVLWANALCQASEERRAPSIAYLPIVTLWANLHGSFTLGLALIVPFAFEAYWTAEKSARSTIAWQWLRFGLLALGAACITPYGLESVLVTIRILKLGETLSNIGEWAPIEFGTLNPVTVCFLAGAAYILYTGFKLSPLRIAGLLALIYETFAHIRYVDVAALVVPFFIASPLGAHLSWTQLQHDRMMAPPARKSIVAIAALGIATALVLALTNPAPPRVPSAAVEKLKELKANRVFNDYPFGGYLILQGIPTFIDSRAELYGAAFLKRYLRAITLEDLPDLVRLLDEYKVESTMLLPSTPAVGLLDRLPEWERVFADDVAVIHIRRVPSMNGNTTK